MSNNLKYLKDYETSTDYEKLWALINTGKKVLTEFYLSSVFTNTIYTVIDTTFINQTGCFQVIIYDNRVNSIHSKKLFIAYCKKHNLHYIMPNEEQEK